MARDLTVISEKNQLENLFNFEYDGTNYIYDLPPLQNNLFWAGNLDDWDPGLTTDQDLKPPAGNDPEFFNNAHFRIQGVSWELPRLEFEENKILRRDFIKSISVPHEVSIKWLEDVYHSVQQYHLNWLNCWYNRSLDCFITGLTGKYRKLNIVSFVYNNSTTEAEEGEILEVPILQPFNVYSLYGLVPKSFMPMKFDYSEDGNSDIVTYTYSVVKTAVTIQQAALQNMWQKGSDNEENKLFENVFQEGWASKLKDQFNIINNQNFEVGKLNYRLT